MKPHLLLDVDGVVFPYGAIAWQVGQKPKDWDEPYIITKWQDGFFGNPAWCHLPQRILDGVQMLHEHFDITWASLRGESAKQFENLLGLPSLPFIDFNFQPGDVYIRKEAKVRQLEEFARNADRPFAWIDDAAIPAKWKPETNQDFALVEPDPKVGLTLGQCAILMEFAMNRPVSTRLSVK